MDMAENIMRKRKRLIGIGILAGCALVGAFFLFCLKQYRINQAVRIYQEFIEGKRTAGSWNIKEIAMPTGEPERRDETVYAIADVTGDGIPELHILGARAEYVIFSVKDGEMYQCGYFVCNMCLYSPLKNGGLLYKGNDRHDYGEHYKYFELDASGEPVNEVYFSWVSKDTDYWKYQEKDIYEFDGQTCTYEEWYELTRKYLRTTAGGGEAARDAVEWTRYCTFKDQER